MGDITIVYCFGHQSNAIHEINEITITRMCVNISHVNDTHILYVYVHRTLYTGNQNYAIPHEDTDSEDVLFDIFKYSFLDLTEIGS